jgi:(1->4)-alpha-D-glucan 1-alpha-D-glucosylmutase
MNIPLTATYRLQLHPGFNLDDAAGITSYLKELGISHLYTSPFLQAAPGSPHGYDVIDHSRVNSELGGEAGFRRLVEATSRNQLGLVLDVVPNHMAISTLQNQWWADVLENGPSSHFASFFDVEWEPPEKRLRNTILIPVLEDHYGRVLDAGGLAVVRDGAHFRVTYRDHKYPVSPNSYGLILGPAASAAKSDALAFLSDAFGQLPRPTATDMSSVRRRHRDIAVLRTQLTEVLSDERLAAAIDWAIDTLNADVDALHRLLELQNYRLAWWKSASRDLGYRRFFDVNTLIALRVEDHEVFLETHRRVLEWVSAGIVDGLRVDHIDGLRDPDEYLERLRDAARDAWIVVEKILRPQESLPASWVVDGTTGYDFLNRVGGLFIDPAAEGDLTDFYREFTGETTEFERLLADKKHVILREVLGSDVNRLIDLLLDICEKHLRHRDYSRHQLTDAVRTLVMWFPVYRSYARPYLGHISDSDLRHIETAVSAAQAERPDLEPSLFEFLRDLLTLSIAGDLESEFVARFQQLTGPVIAKALEDSVFYVYNRFIGLNEVGGDPTVFAIEPADFHSATCQPYGRWPATMLTTATHDAKRGEDVRARLALLSEIPDEWNAAVRRWAAMTNHHRTREWPDRNTEYFFYQTLVGAWPISMERMASYLEKATREARTHTSWTLPNAEYDAAIRAFVHGCLGDVEFIGDVARFVEPLVRPGYINSLAQTLIKLTAPGIPDLYQGTELWTLHLVDPDNRQPVDYDMRRRALAEVQRLSPSEIWRRADSGLPKIWLVSRALQTRARHREAFAPGSRYLPLKATGPEADRVVGFQRGSDVITFIPRLGLRGLWKDTSVDLPAGTWRNVLTEQNAAGTTNVAELWKDFPVALLERAGSGA